MGGMDSEAPFACCGFFLSMQEETLTDAKE